MPDKLSFSKTFQALEDAIGIARQRHTLIAGNIANVDTSNYRPKEIDFKAALDRAMDSGNGRRLVKTDPRHIDFGSNSANGVESFEERGAWNGYNWVDIDSEMTKMIENNLRYKTAAETLLRKIAILKEVIREGGR